MIARCDECDRGRQFFTGYRWDPALGPLTRFRCPDCGGMLRPKRKGESEANILNARLKHLPAPPAVPIRKTGRLAGDVRREKRARA
jgi:hypothetical protein